MATEKATPSDRELERTSRREWLDELHRHRYERTSIADPGPAYEQAWLDEQAKLSREMIAAELDPSVVP